jgi:hypothetical protein
LIVSVDELVLGVEIAMERQPLTVCERLDTNDDGVAIDDVVAAVGAAVAGCPVP